MMEHIVSGAKRFGDDVRRDGIDLEEFSEKLTVELHKIMEELMGKFPEPTDFIWTLCEIWILFQPRPKCAM